MIEKLPDDKNIRNPDTFMVTPSKSIRNDDRVRENLLVVYNVSGAQLSAEEIIAIKPTNTSKKILGDYTSSSSIGEILETPPNKLSKNVRKRKPIE